MGNHEYCENCGENSFHNHRDCDPVKVQETKRLEEIAQEKRREAIANMTHALNEAKISFRIDEWGNAIVPYSNFEDKN